MRKFKQEDLLEMDFNAYLASSSDEEDSQLDNENSNEKLESSEDEDEKIDKYKVGFVLLHMVRAECQPRRARENQGRTL